MSHGRGAALYRSAHPIWTHMVFIRRTHGTRKAYPYDPPLCLMLDIILPPRATSPVIQAKATLDPPSNGMAILEF